MKDLIRTQGLKGVLVLLITLSLLAFVVLPASAISQPTVAPKPDNNIQAYSSVPSIWQGATAYFYQDRGPVMQFTGNRLTASSNASVLTGAYRSITICLVRDLPGFPIVNGTKTTIYPDGKKYTLFRDVPITPGASYRLQYVVDNAGGGDTASISTGLVSWTY